MDDKRNASPRFSVRNGAKPSLRSVALFPAQLFTAVIFALLFPARLFGDPPLLFSTRLFLATLGSAFRRSFISHRLKFQSFARRYFILLCKSCRFDHFCDAAQMMDGGRGVGKNFARSRFRSTI